MLLLAGLALVAAWQPETRLLAVVSLLAGAACALFAVRGYRVEPGRLVIERPLWETRRPLAGLSRVEADGHAMDGSIRLFANGGGFVFAGWFRNRTLGTYRAWVNDPARAVVLHLGKQVWVVATGEPGAFVAAVRQAAGLSR